MSVLAACSVILGAIVALISLVALVLPLETRLKKKLLPSFLVLGILSACLSYYQNRQAQIDAKHQSDEAEKRQNKLQETIAELKLDGARSTSFLSGQIIELKSISSRPVDWSPLATILDRERSSGETNLELQKRSEDLARRLRSFQKEVDGERSRLGESLEAQIGKTQRGSAEVQKLVELERIQRHQLEDREDTESVPLRAEATALRSVITKRTGIDLPEDGRVKILLEDGLATGSEPYALLADYVSALGKSLPGDRPSGKEEKR
jgi:hypothetical protein